MSDQAPPSPNDGGDETRPVRRDEPRVVPGIRASDQEREQVVQALSQHATSGRLTLDELEERIGLAYRATTRAELAQLTTDLPDTRQAAVASTVPAVERAGDRKATSWIVAFMGGTEKRGRWRVAPRVNALAVMGGHDIDLRDAVLTSDDTTIVAVSVMGGMDIYVPDTVDVEIGGFSVMGGTGERGSTRAPRPGAPRIRLLVYNLMGGTDVWRMPEETRGMSLKQAKKAAKLAR